MELYNSKCRKMEYDSRPMKDTMSTSMRYKVSTDGETLVIFSPEDKKAKNLPEIEVEYDAKDIPANGAVFRFKPKSAKKLMSGQQPYLETNYYTNDPMHKWKLSNKKNISTVYNGANSEQKIGAKTTRLHGDAYKMLVLSNIKQIEFADLKARREVQESIMSLNDSFKSYIEAQKNQMGDDFYDAGIAVTNVGFMPLVSSAQLRMTADQDGIEQAFNERWTDTILYSAKFLENEHKIYEANDVAAIKKSEDAGKKFKLSKKLQLFRKLTRLISSKARNIASSAKINATRFRGIKSNKIGIMPGVKVSYFAEERFEPEILQGDDLLPEQKQEPTSVCADDTDEVYEKVMSDLGNTVVELEDLMLESKNEYPDDKSASRLDDAKKSSSKVADLIAISEESTQTKINKDERKENKIKHDYRAKHAMWQERNSRDDCSDSLGK